MRRFFKIGCIALLMSASVFLRAEAAFVPIIGSFEGAEETKDGWRITLLVDGQRASGSLSPDCRYELDGQEVPWDVFFESALHRRIIVELDEQSGEVALCRLEILQAK
ncbi:MAG: hypothetical protein LBQ42_07415 [Synergistaceae bacterium]|jgi:hypothetical protein|nr:hypothetical protein [Synergistaceae bacterium]